MSLSTTADVFASADADEGTALSNSLGERWRDVLVSVSMLALGWALFEWTHRPGLAAVVAAVKFGWSDFLTAFWLRRRDPDRGRGIACFWFYFAAGLWKITVVAFLLAALVAVCVGREGGRPARRVVGTGLALTQTGLFLLSVVAVFGAVRARSFGVRIWVDGSLHGYRKRNLWPVWPTGKNNARGLLLASMILPILMTAFALRFRMNVRMVSLLLAEGMIMTMLIRGAVATTPHECWASAWSGDTDPRPESNADIPGDVRALAEQGA